MAARMIWFSCSRNNDREGARHTACVLIGLHTCPMPELPVADREDTIQFPPADRDQHSLRRPRPDDGAPICLRLGEFVPIGILARQEVIAIELLIMTTSGAQDVQSFEQPPINQPNAKW